MFKKTTLKNGLRIITVSMKNTQTATILVLIGTGSKYETKEINGISHFLEHMLFKGTKKRPNTLKLIEPLDRLGGNYNAFTGEEYTGFWSKVDFKHFDTALDWVSDIFLNSKIEEKEIEKEKRVIIEEINMYLDIPMQYVGDIWNKLLYGDQPAGRLISGEKETIKKIERKDFLNYLKNHYLAENTVICVAGNIDAEKTKQKIERYFKDIKTGNPKQKEKVIEKQEGPRNLNYFKKTDQNHLILGVRGYDIFHSRYYAQKAIAVLLGGFMSSRLWISIREKNGLAYYIRTISENNSDTGYLATQAGIDNKNVEKAIKLILKEYKLLKQKKISEKELQKVKDNLKGSLAISLESSDAKALFYGTQELFTGKILTPEEKFKKIDELTVRDIQETAQDIFQPSKLNLALIGPFKNKTKFQKLLKI